MVKQEENLINTISLKNYTIENVKLKKNQKIKIKINIRYEVKVKNVVIKSKMIKLVNFNIIYK